MLLTPLRLKASREVKVCDNHGMLQHAYEELPFRVAQGCEPICCTKPGLKRLALLPRVALLLLLMRWLKLVANPRCKVCRRVNRSAAAHSPCAFAHYSGVNFRIPFVVAAACRDPARACGRLWSCLWALQTA